MRKYLSRLHTFITLIVEACNLHGNTLRKATLAIYSVKWFSKSPSYKVNIFCVVGQSVPT
jgi:hypothetical protein